MTNSFASLRSARAGPIQSHPKIRNHLPRRNSLALTNLGFANHLPKNYIKGNLPTSPDFWKTQFRKLPDQFVPGCGSFPCSLGMAWREKAQRPFHMGFGRTLRNSHFEENENCKKIFESIKLWDSVLQCDSQFRDKVRQILNQE